MEAGNHVWQRISPTEKKGRTHTSLITVAVLKINEFPKLYLDEKDLLITHFCASGDGGQHLQKNKTAVRIIHKPTGTVSVCQNERSQLQNKKVALEVLISRLENKEKLNREISLNKERTNQIGFGDRGGKIRTIRVKDNLVICNVTNKTISFKEYQKGHIRFK